MTSEKTISHVLLVEDDPGDAGLIRDALRENRFERFDVTWVRTMDEAGAVFSSTTIHALLLDLNLPDSEGQDTVLAGLDMAGDVPVVVLTGNDDLDLARRVMDMGAQDYLFKGACDADSLGRALSKACDRLERACKAGRGEAVAELLAEVELQAEALRAEVNSVEGGDVR
ncbi:response regulator [Desulfonatronum thioautotrophicum]|uniref:response regulator n=1 Tax=Desulfonatronum thioautotrophicum TaxID=617001 RepID=UPI00069B3D58|nr:response regulator [Desulfonatronum thioautotrophicum]